MAITVVNISDTINTFRLKTNEISANIGDKGNFLSGIATANVVEAINSVYKNANSAVHLIGNVNNLDALILERNNLVSAINFIYNNIDLGLFVLKESGIASNINISNAYISSGLITNTNVISNVIVSSSNLFYFNKQQDGTYLAWDDQLNAFRFAKGQANLANLPIDGNPVNQNTLVTLRYANTVFATNFNANISNAYLTNANLYYANIDHANVNAVIFTDNLISFGAPSGSNITWTPVPNVLVFNNGVANYATLSSNNQLINQNTILKVGLANLQYVKVNNSSVSNITLFGANAWNLSANDNTYYFYSTTNGTKLKWGLLPGVGQRGNYTFDVEDVEIAHITFTGFPRSGNTLVSTKFGNVNYVTTVGNQVQTINGIKRFSDTVFLEASPGIWWNPLLDNNYPVGSMGNLISSGHNNMYLDVQKTSASSQYWTFTFNAQDGTLAVPGNVYSNAGKLTLNDGNQVSELKANTVGLYFNGGNIHNEYYNNVNYVVATSPGMAQQVGNLTLHWANLDHTIFTDNAVNFHTAFSNIAFYWVENELGRNGYWGFASNSATGQHERALISVNGYPVNQVQAGANTLTTAKYANINYVVSGPQGGSMTNDNVGQEVGNLTIHWANVDHGTFTDNAVNFHTAFSNISFYWVENPLARNGYWGFASNSATGQHERALISVNGYPVNQVQAGANTLTTAKYANVNYVVTGPQGGSMTNGNVGQEVGNLTIHWANVDHTTFTDNAVNFHTAFSNISFYWYENPLGNDGYWAYTRDSGFGSQDRAFISVNGYPVAQVHAGANTLVTSKYGNLNYLVTGERGGSMTNGNVGQLVGNLTIHWANLDHTTFTDNAVNFHNQFNGLSFYWSENPAGGDGLWAFSRNSGWGVYDRAFISVDGYPVKQAEAGGNTLVTTKFGNINYITTTDHDQTILGEKTFNDAIVITNTGNLTLGTSELIFTDGTNHRELKSNGKGLYFGAIDQNNGNVVLEHIGNINYVTTTNNQRVNGIKSFTNLINLNGVPGLWINPNYDLTYPVSYLGNVLSGGHNNISLAVQKTSSSSQYWSFLFSAEDGTLASPGNVYIQTGQILLDDGSQSQLLKANTRGLYIQSANIVTEATGNLNYVTTTNDQFVGGIKSFTSRINDVNGTIWLNPGNSTTYPSGILQSEHDNGTYTNLLSQKVRKNGLNEYWSTQFVGTDGAYIFPSNIVVQSGQIFLNDDAAAPVGEGTLHLFKANTKGLYYDDANIITEATGNIFYTSTTRNQTVQGDKTFTDDIVITSTGNLTVGTSEIIFTDGTNHRELKSNASGLYFGTIDGNGGNVVLEATGNVNYVTTSRNQTIVGSKTFVNASGTDRTYHSGDIAFLGRGAGNILYWTDNGSNYSPAIYSESQNNLTLDVNSSAVSSNIKLQAKTVYAPYIMFGAQQIAKAVSIGTGSTTIDLSQGNIFECYMSASISSLSITNIQGNQGLTSGTAAFFILKLIYDGSPRTVNWPAYIKWPGGAAPALSSGGSKVDTFSFYTTDFGLTWYGSIVGQNA